MIDCISVMHVLSKSQELKIRLKRELASSDRVKGQRFYSIQEVSQRYQVSAASAYKVIARLVKDGYLRGCRGKGYFIQKKPSDVRPVRQQRATAIMLVNDSDMSGGVQLFEKYRAALDQACRKEAWRLLVARNDARQIEEAQGNEKLAGYVLYGFVTPPAVELDPTRVLSWNSYRCDPNWSLLSADREDVSRRAFEHLWDLGHQRTALVRQTPRGDMAGEEVGRVLGMRKAYASMGLPWSAEDVINVASKDGRGIEDHAADGLYDRLVSQGITGIHCISWHIVLELYRQARERGTEIGRELSIVAHGGHDQADQLDPSPARVIWRFSDFASTAIQAMRRIERGRSLSHRIFFPIYMQPGASARPLIVENSVRNNAFHTKGDLCHAGA